MPRTGPRRKGDPDQVRPGATVAGRDAVVTLAWIAGRLQVGSVAYLNNPLYLLRKGYGEVDDNRT